MSMAYFSVIHDLTFELGTETLDALFISMLKLFQVEF